MRVLSCGVLLSLAALGLASHVEASCQGGPSDTDTPDANALTMFVTSATITTLNGDFLHFGQANGITATVGDTVGLTAADHICNYFAGNPTGATLTTHASHSNTQPYYNQDSNGNTVQFRALLSTDSIDAIDRFASINNINIVNSKDRKCLASNIADLFNGPDGFGWAYNRGNIYDETGTAFSTNTQVWTGTGAIFSATSQTTADKPGGKFHLNGQAVSTAHGFCYNTGLSQPWSTSSVSSNGAIGILVDTNQANAQNYWVYDQNTPNGLACSQGVRLYCISAQAFNPPTHVSGDPQFTGLQGQRFQVHGMPDEFFNLITTPDFQLNSRFTYLASGSCTYNNTECWSHPGTYVDQLGFMFPGITIKTVAGPHHKGLRVWVNDEEMAVHKKLKLTTTTPEGNTTQSVMVRHPTYDTLIVTSSLFTVEITNSDWFFNFNLHFHMPELLVAGRPVHHITESTKNTPYPEYLMHGLVGQTWKNARYAGKRLYQGEIDDYMLLDHTLFSSQFAFNHYQY